MIVADSVPNLSHAHSQPIPPPGFLLRGGDVCSDQSTFGLEHSIACVYGPLSLCGSPSPSHGWWDWYQYRLLVCKPPNWPNSYLDTPSEERRLNKLYLHTRSRDNCFLFSAQNFIYLYSINDSICTIYNLYFSTLLSLPTLFYFTIILTFLSHCFSYISKSPITFIWGGCDVTERHLSLGRFFLLICLALYICTHCVCCFVAFLAPSTK